MGRPKGRKNGQRIKTQCNYCKKVVETCSNSRKYCSLLCYHKDERKIIGPKTCEYCGNDINVIRYKPSGVRDTRPIRFCSQKCKHVWIAKNRKQPKRTTEWKKKISDAQKGEKSRLWKGGLTSINKALRKGIEWKEWRLAVFERDSYTCQECKTTGIELHPHHIKPFAEYPELRFELSNGVTLCRSCHRKTDSWGLNIAKKLKDL